MQLLQDALRLLGRAVLQDALYHSTAVRVSAQRVHLPGERANDELQCPWLDALDALLHHVISILILDALQYVPVELPHDLLLLLRTN